MNERTDLTATEVSPRLDAQVVERISGKLIRINTRKVKLSQEKTSIRFLNVKGRIQTNQIKKMLETVSVATSNHGSSSESLQPQLFGASLRQAQNKNALPQ